MRNYVFMSDLVTPNTARETLVGEQASSWHDSDGRRVCVIAREQDFGSRAAAAGETVQWVASGRIV